MRPQVWLVTAQAFEGVPPHPFGGEGGAILKERKLFGLRVFTAHEVSSVSRETVSDFDTVLACFASLPWTIGYVKYFFDTGRSSGMTFLRGGNLPLGFLMTRTRGGLEPGRILPLRY